MPFMNITCPALPEALMESEPSHERGAFTGRIGRSGTFETADGGTVFRRDRREAPAFRRSCSGSSKRRRSGGSEGRLTYTSTRVISATNRHLRDEVKEGRFARSVHRLNVLPINLPCCASAGTTFPAS